MHERERREREKVEREREKGEREKVERERERRERERERERERDLLIVNQASKITQTPQTSLSELYKRSVMRKATVIIEDASHPLHQLLQSAAIRQTDNNYIKDFPQLADGLMVIPLPVEEQCRGVLSEPQPDLQLLTGDAQFSEAAGYPWSNTGEFAAICTKSNSAPLPCLQFGTHYVSEALYGSELSCTIHFPSKKAQQQLWLQYQKVKIITHSEPAAMSRYEVSAVSTPTGTTMLMTFSADQFLSY
ncbi:hypothetical protein WMY93_020849 [Mugilogobius chulae]|uniref:Uncharacterized protein n=1 Tax=Mugilogobius chulae TaxID=88201 RepID=A0AAW0NK75_9GOBI